MNIADKNAGIQIFELLFSLDIHLGVELLGQIVILCLLFLRTIQLFPQRPHHSILLSTAYKGSIFSISSTINIFLYKLLLLQPS